MSRLVELKKASFQHSNALYIAEKFNKEQMEMAIKLRQDTNEYEYKIIEIILDKKEDL